MPEREQASEYREVAGALPEADRPTSEGVDGAFALILLGGSKAHHPGWDVMPCSGTLTDVMDALSAARSRRCAMVAIWDSRLPLPPTEAARTFVRGRADIVHAGLHVAPGASSEPLKAALPMTWVSLKLPGSIECSSWHLSLRAAFIRGSLLHAGLPALDPTFRALDGAALDWGLRLLRSGVVIRHDPTLLGQPHRISVEPVPVPDQVHLVANNLGRKWAYWSAVYSARQFRDLVSGLREARRPRTVRAADAHRGPERPGRSWTVPARVSVIIPTLERPQQLATLLEQLTDQTRPPDEVVVADQSDADLIDVAALRAEGLPLTVLRLDRRGQSHARNSAIRATTGDLIILLDDDEEIDPTLIDDHLAVYERTGADAIAGGVDVPGIPGDDPTRERIAETFPGGHSSVKRSSLQASGLFDPVFDRGPRADADLGMRLALTGALVLYVPSVRIVHHHAMTGGLRAIGARRVTRSSSRTSLTQRNLPATTQLYLGLRHWGPDEVRASILLGVISGFGHDGSRVRAVARLAIQTALLPSSLLTIRRRLHEAKILASLDPDIPRLNEDA